MSDNYFEGYYFKHQAGDNTVAFIPGRAKDKAFVQVITNEHAYFYNFPKIELKDRVVAGSCEFSTEGIKIDLPDIQGEIQYSELVPIKYDIMGPFKYLPMECRHGVISIHHKLSGSLTIDDQKVLFDNGIGYIEKDSGCSFPKSYLWLQCSDEKMSSMVSIAKIPFLGLKFWGCICVIYFDGREYRLATYLGVKIINASENKIVLKQGRYLLEIDIKPGTSQCLPAPKNGIMQGMIRESNNSFARFKFYYTDELIFDVQSQNAGFEYVNMGGPPPATS